MLTCKLIELLCQKLLSTPVMRSILLLGNTGKSSSNQKYFTMKTAKKVNCFYDADRSDKPSCFERA